MGTHGKGSKPTNKSCVVLVVHKFVSSELIAADVRKAGGTG